METSTITSKTLFWLTSAGKVVRHRPLRDYDAVIFRLEQLIAGQAIEIGLEWYDWDCRPKFGIRLAMDAKRRIVVERFGGHEPLPVKKRRVKVVADNPHAFAKQFGATYNNSLFE